MTETALSTVRDTIIKGALRKVGAYSSLTNPTSVQMEDAGTTLEMMIKVFQIKALLQLKEFVTLFLESGKYIYEIPSTTVNPTYGAKTYYTTAIATAAIATDTSIIVDSTSDIAALDVVAIVLDSNAIHWTTVVSITDSTTFVIDDELPSAAAVDNVVYNYRYNGGLKRPTEISTMTRIDITGSEIPINKMSRQEYADQVNKETSGTPVQLYYDRQQAKGFIYVWPAPNDDRLKLKMTFDRPIEIPTDAQDDLDFPDEYMELLIYGLAVRLAPEYSMPLADQNLLNLQYKSLLDAIIADDIEDTSVFLQPCGRNC